MMELQNVSGKWQSTHLTSSGERQRQEKRFCTASNIGVVHLAQNHGDTAGERSSEMLSIQHGGENMLPQPLHPTC